ncbi:MAG TPA: SpoIIE family protein phosphatase [Thermoanaerobaculaceae bacterium]|nr:SpoIIE family protein phosphatase [Thermoanaerobaculaceae bacterium]
MDWARAMLRSAFGGRPFRTGCAIAFGVLGAGALVAGLVAPHAEVGGVLRVLAVLAALPLAFLGVRRAWRRLTYRVGVRLFLSYVLIGLTPFAICAVAAFIAAYVLVGQYAATRVRAGMRLLDDRILAQATGAAANLGGGPVERAKRLLESDASDGMRTEWLLADGEREWRSAGAGALPVPRWAKEGPFQGNVFARGAAFRAAIARRGAVVAAVLVPLDLGNARAYPHDSWYEVRFVTDLGGAKGRQDRTITVGESGRGADESPLRINGRPVPETEIERGWLAANRPEKSLWSRIRTMWVWLSGAPRDLASGDAVPHAMVLTVIKLAPRGALEDLFGPGDRMRGDVATVATALGTLLAVVYLVALAFAVVMILRVTRATARLSRGARAVTRGDFDHLVPVGVRDQLGDLAVSFNSMSESVRNMLESVAERERLAREMELAREIQESLLPPSELTAGPLSVWAHFRPAADVGGDYFDLFPLASGRLMVAVGDVAGHGLHTGLLMAMVKSAVATLVQEGRAGLELLEKLNQLLLGQPIRHRMVSLAVAEIDASRRSLEITSAGHPPGMLLADGGDVEELLVPSLPLGHRWPEPPPSRTRRFGPGSRLLLYSDGLVEARAPDGRPFGYDALRDVLRAHWGAPAGTVIGTVLEELDRHLGGQPLADDLTLLVVEHRGTPGDGPVG